MTPPIHALSLTGAQVLHDGRMQGRTLGFAGGRIADGDLPEVDLSGYLLLPGIIDLHGDGFERHMAPRPSAPFPHGAGLASYDHEAAAHGVTTAYLAQGWSWEGGHRSPDQAEALMAALEAYRAKALTDLRVQIRAETHLVEAAGRLIAAVARYGVGFVVFNDHLEEGLHMARTDPADFAAWAKKLGKTLPEMQAAIDAAALRAREVPRSLCRLAEAFDAAGVTYGSHDDPDGETREYYCNMGARIAEFPLSRRAAAAAKAMASPVVMGAPNVVRGKSQAGNVSATSLLAEGLCDALVSDYHLPALPLAAWTLVDKGVMGLAEAWGVISTGPAAVLGLADRGRLEPGLRADIAIVNADSRAVEGTICGGRIVYLAGEAAGRFMLPRAGLRLAAE